ncbi:unnamed protein product, partial [Brachionus calyciflorus]
MINSEIENNKIENRSSSSSPIRTSHTPHAVSNILNLDYQSQYPTALMAALTASLNPYYRETLENSQNDTPPMSASSSSSLNTTPNNIKKKGLSDVINKLHKAASNQTTPNKSGDESTENDETESQTNEQEESTTQIQSDININKSHQKLYELLLRANLLQYFNSFIEQGGDDLDQLCDANENEFKEICDLVGMSSKPLHVKRLKKALDELKFSKSQGQKFKTSHSVQKFLPESNLSLSLPTPHSTSSSSSSSSSSASSTISSTSSFSISNLFNRSDSPNQSQGLLTTGSFVRLYQTSNQNVKQEEEVVKKDEIESDEDNFEEDYVDTDDGDEEDEEDDSEESKIPVQSTNLKLEQNEKMIKKNKVIELYTKGERCVRKLSQLTGVPLTTVYRVIGKLKGINYNIPRGNGAGRKTILDAQDREILVEILNKQPRISRKALGKELEKLTGKSIHNSTLNRELCRLRYQNNNGQNVQNDVKLVKKFKKFDELNEECLKMIHSESKRYGCQMSQSEFECKPLSTSLSPNLSKQIIEICQMSTNLSQNSSQQYQQIKLDKIKQTLDELLNLTDSFYDKCVYEASVQLCLQKPTLLTRHDDLVQSQNFDLNSYLNKIRMNLYQSQQESLRSLIEKNEAELKINLKKQEDVRLRLFGLSMSSNVANNEQIRPIYESLQSQLGDLIKRHAQLLSEQARLKSQDFLSS